MVDFRALTIVAAARIRALEHLPRARARAARERAGARRSGRAAVASTAMSERTPVAPYMAVGLSTIVHGVARAPAHPAQPRHHRGRDPRRGLDHRHQHAREADRAGRGRADRLHGRDLRHPARHGRARAVHRHPGRGERAARRARAPVRDLHRRAVQGALARGHARPLLQHAVRDLAAGRDRAQAPPRTTSGAASARARRTTSTTAGSSSSATASRPSTRCCAPTTSATSGTICCSDGEYPEAVRALAFGGAEVVYRPSEAVPMTQTRRARRHVDAAEPRARALQQPLRRGPERRARLRAPAHGAPVRHRRRQLAHRRLPGQRDRAHRLGRQQLRRRRSSTSRRCASSAS